MTQRADSVSSGGRGARGLTSIGELSAHTIAGKICTIIQSFTGHPEQSMTQIARFSGLPLSTTHRLVSQIAAHGLLERGEKGRYHLGALLGQLGSSWNPPVDYRFPIGGVLEDLAAATGFPTRFGMLCADLEVSYLECPDDIRRGPCVPGSERLPAGATAMGKVILAHIPPHVLERHIRCGQPAGESHTAASAAQLGRELSTIRQQGIASSRVRLHEQPAWALAVPVLARNGWAVGALELTIPGNRSDGARAAMPALIVAARRLSRWFAEPSSRQPAEPDLTGPLRRDDLPDAASASEPAYGCEAAV